MSSIVDTVVVKRIERVDPNGEPVTVPTPAEGCVRDLLLRLELPPGGGRRLRGDDGPDGGDDRLSTLTATTTLGR